MTAPVTEPVCTLDLARMRRDRVAKLDRGDARGRRRHARAVRPAERVVRDGRPGAGGRSRARRRGGARSRSRAGRALAAPLHRLPRRRARGDPRRLPAPRDRGRDSRPARPSSPAGSAAAASRSTTRPSRCGRRCAAATSSTRARCSAPRSSRRRPTSSSASARPRRSTKSAMRAVRPLAVPGALTDRSLRRVPARGRRARRDGEHRRPRLPGHAPLGRERAVQHHRRARLPDPDPRASRWRPATCSGSTPASTSTATPPTSARHGSSAAIPTTSNRISSHAGARSSTARWTRGSRAPPPPTSSRPRASPTAPAPGSRTSTSRTASAPTAPRCRSSGPTSATRSTGRSSSQPGMVLVFEPVVWDDGYAGHRSRGDRRGHRRRLLLVVAPGRARRGRRSREPYRRVPRADGARRRRRPAARPRGRTRARVSDAARLWLAGTRVFSPGCVVVRRTGAVHVLANTDAVVPTGFPVDRLYGVTWNPEKLLASLVATSGGSASCPTTPEGLKRPAGSAKNPSSVSSKALPKSASPRSKPRSGGAGFEWPRGG